MERGFIMTKTKEARIAVEAAVEATRAVVNALETEELAMAEAAKAADTIKAASANEEHAAITAATKAMDEVRTAKEAVAMAEAKAEASVRAAKAVEAAVQKNWSKSIWVVVIVPTASIILALVAIIAQYFSYKAEKERHYEETQQKIEQFQLEHFNRLKSEAKTARMAVLEYIPANAPAYGFPVNHERTDEYGKSQVENDTDRIRWEMAHNELSKYIDCLQEISELLNQSEYLRRYLHQAEISFEDYIEGVFNELLPLARSKDPRYDGTPFYHYNRDNYEHIEEMRKMAEEMRWNYFENRNAGNAENSRAAQNYPDYLVCLRRDISRIEEDQINSKMIILVDAGATP